MGRTSQGGEPGVNVEQAQQVRRGDTVVFERTQRRVMAVSHDGLWAPYFDLDEDGLVSHLLVEVPAERQGASPDEMPAVRLPAVGEGAIAGL
jgi:hypothetical protein